MMEWVNGLEMDGRGLRLILLAALVANVVTWAAYRFDKYAAGRGWRRIPERDLLSLTVLGGLGAMLGMYAAKQRHKTQKTYFVVSAWLFAAVQLVGLGYATSLALR